MLVAKFGPTSVLVGKTITYEGGQFILQDYGPLTLEQVIGYDRQGHLTWTRDDLRGWVYDVAGRMTVQQPTTVLPQVAPPTVPQTAQTIPQPPPSKAAWGGGTAQPGGLSSGAKTLIGVGIGLVVLVLIVAVAASGGGSSSLTSTEQTQFAFFVEHAPQMRALIEDTQAVLDSSNTDATYVGAAMGPIVDSYGQLADEYKATNGGNLVGGQLAHLESLWESCARDIGTADTTILECYTSPATVDTEAGGVALGTATVTIDEIDTEIDRLSNQ
jgi:hypothetical protein